MKKLAALLCVLLATITLSACQSFHDDKTTDYPTDEPLTMSIFLQLNDLPLNSTVDAELSAWLGQINRQIETTANHDGVKIRAVEAPTAAGEDIYTVQLTLSQVPATTLERSIRPFKITYTQHVYNPIELLPESSVFTYIVGYTTGKRHSAVNTDWIQTDDDGSYIYLWTTDETIEFVDVYPNRPLYYLFVVAGAAVIGLVVYFVSRYIDCKKRQKQL